jgi:HD-like signal output (HDOD) protein
MLDTGFKPMINDLNNNALYQDCYSSLQSDCLLLPTIPDIAVKVRRAINDSHASSAQIAKILQADMSISARLIQIANSPLFGGRRKTESCPEALTRLGLKTSQDIIVAFAIKAVFNAKSALIRQKMQTLWTHSSHVAAISAILAHKTSGFDPDKAMLAGLIHDIGVVPILTYMDQRPDIIANPAQLNETVKALRIPIGQAIIGSWDFPADFAEVIKNAENWFRESGEPASYSDIVMIAQYHSFIGKTYAKKMPKLNELPAYQKLLSGQMNAEVSFNILEQAQEDIDQIRQMLS